MNSDTKNRKGQNTFEYLIIICLFYVTGGAFNYYYYNVQIISLFILTMLGFMFYRYKKYVSGVAVCILMFQSLFLLIVPLINDDSISTYIAIAMQLAIGFFCAYIIPKEHFIDKFIKVITAFAAISLIGFGISFIFPQIAHVFPMLKGEGNASVDYYNAGIYVFMQPKGYGSLFTLTNRNAGICWEPGCYQAFLNLGLFFLLEKDKTNPDKRFLRKFLILVLTVLTTVSTTGIIVLVILLCAFMKIWSRRLTKTQTAIFIIPIVAVAGLFVLNQMEFADFVSDKFHSAFMQRDNSSVWERISIDRIKYIFSDGHFWFFGMSFAHWVTYGVTLWNSIIHSFLCLGIPFTCIQLLLYWKGTKAVSTFNILLFIIIMMCFSTETLFWRVFFNTIAFYGMVATSQPFEVHKPHTISTEHPNKG